jgi:hypothetical protein
MTSLGFPIRRFLKFSKLKRIASQFNNYTTTAPTQEDLNGKDLYAPKYGNSHYESQHYHANFFHTPQCMPHLKDIENEYYDEQDKNTDKEKTKEDLKKIFDCENERWTDRED